MRLPSILAPLLLCLAVHIHAETVLYDINFSTGPFGFGDLPTSGSFGYDASQPLGSQFTNFIVVWEGISFDLTSDANFPSFVNTDTSACFPTLGSAGVFAALSAPGNCLGVGSDWLGIAHPDKLSAQFKFEFVDAALDNSVRIFGFTPIPFSLSPLLVAQGHGIRIIAAAVPEPTELPLLVTGVLALVLGTKSIRALL